MKSNSWIRKSSKSRPNRAFLWNSTFKVGVMVFWGVGGRNLPELIDWQLGGITPEEKRFIGRLKQAKFVSLNNSHCIAFRDLFPPAGMVAHEALHCVNFILDEAGVPVNSEQDETHAYLLEWLVDNVMELTRNGRFQP